MTKLVRQVLNKTVVLSCCWLLASSTALAQGAPAKEGAAPPATPTTDEQAQPSADAASGEQAGEPTAGEDTAAPKPLPLPSAENTNDDDTKPPVIEDVAVAASSPKTAPMVTVIITDDWSGVEKADVFYRKPGEAAFVKTPLSPGRGGLFIARLPDGLQTVGFEYYVEVWDAAGNGPARMGRPDAPLLVEAASEGTIERLAREEEEASLGPVHPAWMMLSLGGGVLAAAASGVFWLDFMNLQTELAAETDPARRTSLEDASLGDAVIGSVLGVLAGAGLATGVALLVYSALEE